MDGHEGGHGGHEGGHTGHEGSHGGHEGGDHDMNMMDHSMKMYFHIGNTETILFKEWAISTDGGLVGSAIGIFFMAVFYEAFKCCRQIHANKMLPARKNTEPTMFNVHHFIQSIMHAFQFIISYFLMFIFMTFNVWLCLAVVLGAAVGYFLFNWKNTTTIATDCCI